MRHLRAHLVGHGVARCLGGATRRAPGVPGVEGDGDLVGLVLQDVEELAHEKTAVVGSPLRHRRVLTPKTLYTPGNAHR